MIRVLIGDALEMLRTLPDESVQCCVTSPPYWGLRDYGVAGQIGLEPTPGVFVARLVAVFREVRRVLRSDGTCWVNMGDSYAASSKGSGGTSSTTIGNGAGQLTNMGSFAPVRLDIVAAGLKAKDLCGMPWRLAFALQDDGWVLRSDIIWAKPNPMPESVTDRPTKSHEYVFLLTKAPRYFYDADAIADPSLNAGKTFRTNGNDGMDGYDGHRTRDGFRRGVTVKETRNARTVWTIPTEAFSEAHFATFPTELARRCIAAGTKPGDTVLDPFGGAGTTGLVADRMQRDAILIELNPAYAEMAWRRIADDAGMFAEVSA